MKQQRASEKTVYSIIYNVFIWLGSQDPFRAPQVQLWSETELQSCLEVSHRAAVKVEQRGRGEWIRAIVSPALCVFKCPFKLFLHYVFSNVSSRRLHSRMHSQIVYICLTFLHCVFSNVSLNYLPKQKQSYIGCICAFSNASGHLSGQYPLPLRKMWSLL